MYGLIGLKYCLLIDLFIYWLHVSIVLKWAHWYLAVLFCLFDTPTVKRQIWRSVAVQTKGAHVLRTGAHPMRPCLRLQKAVAPNLRGHDPAAARAFCWMRMAKCWCERGGNWHLVFLERSYYLSKYGRPAEMQKQTTQELVFNMTQILERSSHFLGQQRNSTLAPNSQKPRRFDSHRLGWTCSS